MALRKSVIRDELHRIAQQDGFLTPRMVVQAARDARSPLHDSFEWDDRRAAEAHRLWQARHLIAGVRVEIKGKPVDAFHSVRVVYEDDSADTRYYPVETVIKVDDMRKQLLKRALDEVVYWQEKYKEIEELEGVVDEKQLVVVAKKAGVEL